MINSGRIQGTGGSVPETAVHDLAHRPADRDRRQRDPEQGAYPRRTHGAEESVGQLDGDVVEAAHLVFVLERRGVTNPSVSRDVELGVHLRPGNQHERPLRELRMRDDEIGVVDGEAPTARRSRSSVRGPFGSFRLRPKASSAALHALEQ